MSKKKKKVKRLIKFVRRRVKLPETQTRAPELIHHLLSLVGYATLASFPGSHAPEREH